MTALDDRVARALATLKEHPTLMLDVPHPDPRQAASGKKLRSKVTWLLQHAGRSGRTRACRWTEEALRRRREPDMLRGHPSVAGKP
jgi:hypothetical protein